MDNQHRKITGYRELSQDEIDLVNEIKCKGEGLGELVGRVAATGDPRWAAIAKTDLQIGIMALVRAVAQPGSF